MKKMALSKSTNTDTEYVEYRDRLYWGKYKYKGVIELPGIHMYKWFSFPLYQLPGRIQNPERKTIIEQNLPMLNLVCPMIKQLIKGDKANISIRSEGDKLSICTNNLSILDGIKAVAKENMKLVTASVVYDVGVKYFVRQPKHKFRVYLKSVRITPDTKTELIKFLSEHENMFPSKTLGRWMASANFTASYHRFMSSTWYVDLDDDTYISYLHLMFGDVFGKTYSLEKRP